MLYLQIMQITRTSPKVSTIIMTTTAVLAMYLASLIILTSSFLCHVASTAELSCLERSQAPGEIFFQEILIMKAMTSMRYHWLPF